MGLVFLELSRYEGRSCSYTVTVRVVVIPNDSTQKHREEDYVYVVWYSIS